MYSVPSRDGYCWKTHSCIEMFVLSQGQYHVAFSLSYSVNNHSKCRVGVLQKVNLGFSVSCYLWKKDGKSYCVTITKLFLICRSGFVIFYDFLLGLDHTLYLIRLVSGLYRNGQEMCKPSSLPIVSSDMGVSSQYVMDRQRGSCAILAARQPVPRWVSVTIPMKALLFFPTDPYLNSNCIFTWFICFCLFFNRFTIFLLSV